MFYCHPCRLTYQAEMVKAVIPTIFMLMFMFVFHYMYILNVPIRIVTDNKERSGRWDVNCPC
jgi:hypothetical protein